MKKLQTQLEPNLERALAKIEQFNASTNAPSYLDLSLLGLEPLASMFDDSSCEIWRLSIENEYVYLKLEKAESTETTDEPNTSEPFWLMMQHLFDISLTDALKNTADVIEILSKQTILQIPKVYKTFNLGKRAGIALSEMKGASYSEQKSSEQNATQHDYLDHANAHVNDYAINSISNISVQNLAQYLAALHDNNCMKTGALNQTNLSCTVEKEMVDEHTLLSWQERLAKLFARLGCDQHFYFDKESLARLKISSLVPVMMDLRWDQFAFENGDLSGVYDLDAYVAAPIELDFVILEFLLNKSQLDYFIKAYRAEAHQPIPIINEVRAVYRHLFFLVNALGETDYKKWMNHPHYFD